MLWWYIGCLKKIWLAILWYNLSSVKYHEFTECPVVCMGSPHVVRLQYHKMQRFVAVIQSRSMEICNFVSPMLKFPVSHYYKEMNHFLPSISSSYFICPSYYGRVGSEIWPHTTEWCLALSVVGIIQNIEIEHLNPYGGGIVFQERMLPWCSPINVWIKSTVLPNHEITWIYSVDIDVSLVYWPGSSFFSQFG